MGRAFWLAERLLEHRHERRNSGRAERGRTGPVLQFDGVRHGLRVGGGHPFQFLERDGRRAAHASVRRFQQFLQRHHGSHALRCSERGDGPGLRGGR